MTSEMSERLEVARVFGRLSASAEGRRYLAENDYTSGTPVIAALYGDEIGSVLRRRQKYGRSDCVVAMVHNGELEAIVFRVADEKDPGASSEVSKYSCIGMLIEAVKRSERQEKFRFTSTRLGVPAASFSRPVKVPATV